MRKNASKYAAAMRKNFTPEELKRAEANFAYGAKRFPKEHANAVALIEQKGLKDHREIVGYYASYKMPISPAEIARIETYADSTYIGAFGKGK